MFGGRYSFPDGVRVNVFQGFRRFRRSASRLICRARGSWPLNDRSRSSRGRLRGYRASHRTIANGATAALMGARRSRLPRTMPTHGSLSRKGKRSHSFNEKRSVQQMPTLRGRRPSRVQAEQGDVSHFRDFQQIMDCELKPRWLLRDSGAGPGASAGGRKGGWARARRVHVVGHPYWSTAPVVDYGLLRAALACAAGHDRSVFWSCARLIRLVLRGARVAPGRKRSMSSGFAASGLAGTTYRTLFRRQIMRVRPRVVGMAVAYVSASGLSLVRNILDEGGVGAVRLVTDTKDGVTHPRALRGALENGWDVRIVDNLDGTFHPKLYVGAARFDDDLGVADVSLAITGSPNISRGGFLKNGECVFWSAAPHGSAAQAWLDCWNAGVAATEARIREYERNFARRNRGRKPSDLVALGIAENIPAKADGVPTRGVRPPRMEHRALSEVAASVAWAGLQSFTGEYRLQVEFPRGAGEVLRRIFGNLAGDDSVEMLCTDGVTREFKYRYYTANGMFRLNIPNDVPLVAWAREHKRGVAYVEHRGTQEGLQFEIVQPGQAMDEIVDRSLALGTWGRTPTRPYGWY